MKNFCFISIVVAIFTISNSAHAAENLQVAKLFANLPDNCPTPDAFAIAPNGSLTLSCPNFANNKLQGELFSVDKLGNVSHLVTVPKLGLSKKANPMGIAYDSQGALYVADARGIKDGRILKMSFDQNKLVKTEIVASGINPNGLRIHDSAVYITQPMMPKINTDGMISGIYRFSLTDRDKKMTNSLLDKELIFNVQTDNPDIQVGLDGLDFDKDGYLFTTDLGDGEVYKLTLDSDGDVVRKELYMNIPNDARIDGMVFDDEGNLYLAGFGLNQVFKITSNKRLIKIADYPDNDGSNGQIDQPADLMVYDGKLVISNFDLMKGNGLRNTEHSKPYTLSYINLKKF